jgi:pimeloyl-ACP methyl ester carboxylesterase
VIEDFNVELAGACLAVRRIAPDQHPGGTATLVFLHEGLGSIESWRDFPAELVTATGCPAVVYDRRGYGQSDALDRPWGIDYLHQYALDELPALLEVCGVTQPLLIGHSDGGTIALIYGSEHPTVGLIAEAAHVHVEEAARRGIRHTIEMWKSGSLEARLSKYHGPKTRQIFWRWADTWLAPWFEGWSIEAELRRVRCPALLLQGADDEYATPGHLDVIGDSLGGPVCRELVPDCGHAPHLQAPAAVLDRCARFITELVAADRPAERAGRRRRGKASETRS